MKLQVTQENLNRALGSVSRVASSRGTLPILANVLLKTVGNRLSIAATNLDIAITHFTGAKVSKEGAITVPARLMQDFISSLPSGVIDIDLDDNKLHISTDQYRSTINGVAADEYPIMPAITNGQKWTIGCSELKKALQQVIFAASTDEARPILTGVYIHSFEGKLFMVSTDSYRLAQKELKTTTDKVSLLIPASSLNDLLRVMGDGEEEVEITYDDQQVMFKLGEVELVTRLIEGDYPDYRKLIPAKFSNQATLKKADFVNVTKVSSLFARESAGSVTINVGDNKLSIESIASQVGENSAAAEAKVTGEGSVTLNSRYVIDALGAIGGDQVSFSFNGKLEPCRLTDPGDKDYLHIIMPLKS